MKKKLLAMLLISLMTVTFASCGSKDVSTDSNSNDEGTKTEVTDNGDASSEEDDTADVNDSKDASSEEGDKTGVNDSEGSKEATDNEEKYKAMADKDGYAIEDGILYAYFGNAKKITIPSGVKRLYDCSLSWDLDHGTYLEEVVVPGTVKNIDKGAFSFTIAKKIKIEEGVESIGDNAFMDSYIDEIWFPASLSEIGKNIMETEEGLNGCKIHVPKGSAIAKYFKNKMPYGDAKLIYE